MNDNKQKRLTQLRILSEKYNLDVDSMFSLVTIGKLNALLCILVDPIQIDTA